MSTHVRSVWLLTTSLIAEEHAWINRLKLSNATGMLERFSISNTVLFWGEELQSDQEDSKEKLLCLGLACECGVPDLLTISSRGASMNSVDLTFCIHGKQAGFPPRYRVSECLAICLLDSLHHLLLTPPYHSLTFLCRHGLTYSSIPSCFFMRPRSTSGRSQPPQFCAPPPNVA